MSARVLGVTGYIASGKDTVCRFLRQWGFVEIDVDLLGHRVLEETLPLIESRFGRSFSDERGGADRRVLGRYVFADPERLRTLEGVVHPEMVRRIEEALPGFDGPVVINAALLYKMKLDALCDVVLQVTAPDDLLVERAVARGGLDREEAEKRLRMQKRVNPIPETSDQRIENTCTPEELKLRVLEFAETIFGEGPYGTEGTKWPPGDVHPEPGQ